MDKAAYLKRFARVALEELVLVHGYCLMDNHVHWLLTPTTTHGLARLFQRVHTWWAMHFNRETKRTGHLFESRFHSSPLSECHYWAALRYVDLNPRNANPLNNIELWKYSSARCHLTGLPDPRIDLVPAVTRRHFTPADWREFLNHNDPEKELALLRALPGSRPCGSTEHIRSCEQCAGRKLGWSPRGRPPKRELHVMAA